MQDSAATVAAVQAAQPNRFFSLPGELRNHIYDILHQHEKSTRFHSLTFRYPVPLSHLRLINRQFTSEFDKRTPAVNHLVIAPTSRNQVWFPLDQPPFFPQAVTRRIGLNWKLPIFKEFEVNIDVCDTYHEPVSPLLWFDKCSHWLANLFHRNTHLVTPARGGYLHLRLFFNYLSNLERLQNEISCMDWYRDFCTKISLVYDGDEHPRAQAVATRSKGAGWETDDMVIEKGYAEWAIGRQQADRVAVSESA